MKLSNKDIFYPNQGCLDLLKEKKSLVLWLDDLQHVHSHCQENHCPLSLYKTRKLQIRAVRHSPGAVLKGARQLKEKTSETCYRLSEDNVKSAFNPFKFDLVLKEFDFWWGEKFQIITS